MYVIGNFKKLKNHNDHLVLNQYNCAIPTLNFGKHLEHLITRETAICSDEVTRKAIDQMTSSNCTRAPTCDRTRFKFTVNEEKSREENTELVWIAFSNPEVVHHTVFSGPPRQGFDGFYGTLNFKDLL